MPTGETRDARLIAKAIDDNTREIKNMGKLLERAVKPMTIVNNPARTLDIPEQIVIHRAKNSGVYGCLFAAECDDIVLVDRDILTVSLNEAAINCPSCKTP